MNSFANTLLHSSCAAARVGPKMRRPRRRKQIDDAAIERQLGTDDREIDAFAFGERTRARRDRAESTATMRAIDARCPALPGAQTTASTPGSRASFQASACSRPPRPDDQHLHGAATARSAKPNKTLTMHYR